MICKHFYADCTDFNHQIKFIWGNYMSKDNVKMFLMAVVQTDVHLGNKMYFLVDYTVERRTPVIMPLQ